MKRFIASALLVYTPCFGWDAGIDFRATSSFVTDPAYAVFAAMGSTAYPTSATVNGQTVVFGWESLGANIVARDRVATGDPRVSGINCQLNDGATSIFRVDLPSVGNYNIGLAAGDPSGFSQNNYVTIRDNNTNLFSVYSATGIGAANMSDATGALWSLSAWPGSNLTVQRSFGTATLRVVLGGTVNNAYSCISHLRVTSVLPPSRSPGAWPFFVL